MKKHNFFILLHLIICLMLSISCSAFAADYSADMLHPDISGILPRDTLMLPDTTQDASLIACWGVRVRFIDWDLTELKSVAVPVTDTVPGSTDAPVNPVRSGYIFTGWKRRDTGSTAVLQEDGTVTEITGPGPVEFIAEYRESTGSLTVSKTVNGAEADSQKEFSFIVSLSDSSLSGVYGDMSFLNGQSAFTLKHGESKTAVALPEGVTYAVVETDDSSEGYSVTKTDDTGAIEAGKTAAAVFINTKTPPPSPPPPPVPTGSLIVSKTVSGSGADSSSQFSFTVTLGDSSIGGLYGGMFFTSGVASFSLRGGEFRTASGLPAGVSYFVSEADYSSSGYSTTSSGASGVIPKEGTAVASFTNTRSSSPPPVKPQNSANRSPTSAPKTGDSSSVFLWLLLLSASGSILILSFGLRNHLRKQRMLFLQQGSNPVNSTSDLKP